MPAESFRRKRFLFVDDDKGFLAGLLQLFSEMSKGTWEIFTAENHSQALALLRQHSMDVVVLDLEVFTGKVRGRVFVCDGDIVHAESGNLQGEVALYGLLGLRGGEFNLRPFSEPPTRTISGHYEFLLMEAARLVDEGTNPLDQS